jgi:predicted transcriptional regulator of viral defense system
MRLFVPCYIGGWTAAGHWGLTEQLFRATLVVTRRHMRQSETNAGGHAYRVVRDRRTTTAGLKPVWRGNARVLVSDVERTLVDACGCPDWIGGGGMLASAFRSAAEEDRMTPANLLKAARHAPSGAALGRLGVLIDRFLPAAESARKYAAKHRGTGYVRFDPAVKRNASLATRWGVWLNVDLGGDA